MKRNAIRNSLACASLMLLGGASASAEMLFVFSPAPGGGVKVVGSGSGLADRVDNAGGGIPVTANDWDVQDIMPGFLKSSFTTSQQSATSASGLFTNVTTGDSATISNFSVDRDPDSADDIDWFTDPVSPGGAAQLTFNNGDEFLFSLMATFDAGTLPFSELVIGESTDPGHTQGAGIADESFGITTVRVVPEPASIAIFFGCVASLVGCRRMR